MQAQDSTGPPVARSGDILRIIALVALFYLADGLAQPGGLINQSLLLYLKEALGWPADRAAFFLSAMILPLVAQPLFGLLTDCLPLCGYRRKSYLLAANLLAASAYAVLTFVHSPSAIFAALMFAAIGMAGGNTVAGAVMVENGKKTGLAGSLINQQWLWFNIAALGVASAGGWLAHRYGAGTAYQHAAALAGLAPLAVAFGSWFLLRETPVKRKPGAIGARFSRCREALKSRTVWLVGGFLVAYNFSPGLGVPLFYHMTDHLHFSQTLIGGLGSLGALGAMLGALAYEWLRRRLTLKRLLCLSILMATLGHFSYLLLQGESTALALSLVNGCIGMVVLVSSLTLAADSCPDGAEGFTYSLLTSLATLAYMVSSNLGGVLYQDVFGQRLAPLIVISAVCTVAALPMVAWLKLGDRRPGEKGERT